MKRIWIALVLALLLTGCKVQQEIRLDTIVDIPLHPTEPVADTSAVETETAESMTEETTQPETIPEQKPTEDSGKTETGGKTNNSSGKGTSGKTEKPTEPKTERPTAAPATQPPTDPPTEAPTEAPDQFDLNSVTPGSLEYGVIGEINARRAEAGLDPLTSDLALCRLAALRAWENRTIWSHTRPDGSDFRTVFSQYGYPCAGAAENIYFGAYGAADIVEKWMSSEKYSANLLLDASAIGAGSCTDENGLRYVVVLIVW